MESSGYASKRLGTAPCRAARTNTDKTCAGYLLEHSAIRSPRRMQSHRNWTGQPRPWNSTTLSSLVLGNVSNAEVNRCTFGTLAEAASGIEHCHGVQVEIT